MLRHKLFRPEDNVPKKIARSIIHTKEIRYQNRDYLSVWWLD